MKNKFFKFILFVLMFTFLLGVVGCSDSDKGYYPGDGEPSDFGSIDRVSYAGTHDINVSDTDNYLVRDGRTDYTVVISEDASDMVSQVKTDFIILFKKATGISLGFQFDNNITDFTENSKYISIGNTSLVSKAGISKDEFSVANIKKEGIRIITKNQSVFILGGDDFGVCNAVYKFLEIYFNFDYYYRNCIEIDTNVTECKFKNLDVTDIPDVNSFYGSQQVYEYDKSIHNLDAEGLGYDTVADEIKAKNLRASQFIHPNYMFLPIHRTFDISSPSGPIHNVMYYINTQVEGVVDDMFASASQLCYTAHGNPEVLEKMIEICAEKIIFSLKNYTPEEYPYRNYVTFTMTDNGDICSCPNCKADYAQVKYSGNLIKFANKLGEKVEEWLESQKDEDAEFHYAYRENFKILTYGYNVYTDPPVDENGTPLSEEVVCRENIGIWHVSSRGVSAHADTYDEKWPDQIKQIQGWKAITQKSNCLWFWHNSGNIVNNIYFSDGFTTYSNNFFEAMAYGNYELVYSAHYLQGGGEMTAWHNCLSYVQSKIRWDVTRDMNYYIQKYMKAMYLEASDIMYELLMQERIHYANLVVNAETDNNWGRDIKSKENYPYLVLKGWVEMCDKAIEKIAYLKESDPTLYKVVHQRIELENIAHLYKIYDLYGKENERPFNDDTLSAYKQRIREISLITPSLQYNGKPLYALVG
ncbi:MAG: DUF4838 domain-containing protein [Clostridiales bacterium]|nr:DUF4838 domain-containing protein [Clostridiales bacterium]